MICMVLLVVFCSTISKASFVITKKLEAKYVFRSVAKLLYINRISVTEVFFFFKITELHGITRLLQVSSTGITLTSGSRTAAILVRYGNKKVKVV
jgi:hypothetical protein